LWKSEDRGQTWITWTHNLTDSSVPVMAFHPTDPLKLYVGTRDGNTFRSTDGGESWQFMGQACHSIGNLTVNPFIPDELWALKPYGGGGGAHGQGLSKYESGSWTPVFTTPVYSFVASRNISGTMWIGTAWDGSLKSTDGGHTWLPFGNLPRGKVIGLAVDPTDSKIVYLGAGGRGVYKTTDDGATFYPVNNGLAGIVPMAMAVAPTSPSTVYAVAHEVGTFKTNNGGGSWLQLPNENTWLATVGVDPITPTRVYLATGGEYVDISDDGGYNWHRAVLSAPVQYQDCAVENQAMLVNAGLPGHLVMGVGFLSAGEGGYIAGGIYTSTDYGESWTYVDVGHPISAVVSLAHDPLSPTVIYAGTGASNSAIGIGTINGELLKSSDGGNTWQPGPAGLDEYFFESMAVEPGPLHRVFACCGDAGVYVSTDGGMSWTPATSSSPYRLSELLFAPGDPPTLYGGTDIGLYRSIDGAQSWQQAAGTLGAVNVRALALGEAQDRVILYVSTAGGMVSGGATRAQSLASGETLVSAGVYRYMIRQLYVYLPVVFKGQ
jgi:photosystem II stability/assembly factor-like uncharacterized protein